MTSTTPHDESMVVANGPAKTQLAESAPQPVQGRHSTWLAAALAKTARGIVVIGLATGAVGHAQTLPDLITYSFTLAETATLPGTSTTPGSPCSGTIAAMDQIGALALAAGFYQNDCYTDGRYNHGNYRVDRGTVSAPGGAANLAAYRVYEPAQKATQFLGSKHVLYYRFPTIENYSVYTYSGGALSKVAEVPATAIPNTTGLVPVPSAASPITVSEIVGSITYVFVPSATRVSSYSLLASGVEGARVVSTPFGDVLKYRYTVAGTPFDSALDYAAGPDSHANVYSDVRRFFLVRNGDNLGVAWQAQGSAAVNLTWFGADRKSPATVALPNPQAQRLVCATGDDTGNVYYLTVQPGYGAPNTARAATLTKVGASGAVIASTPVDMSESALNMVAFDQLGGTTNVAALRFLNGKLALMTGRTMHQSIDGLNHQGGVAAVFNATTLVIEKDWGQTSGHSFENVLTSNANGEFVGIDLGDNFPRGIHLHKFTGTNKNSRVISTFKTQHGTVPQARSGGPTYPAYTEISGGGTTYYRWSNDNRTYTELGGLAQTALGYAVTFVGERSAGGRLLDNGRVGGYLNDPRNIGWVTVREDFQNASGDGAEVSDDLVVSAGLVETAGYYSFTGDWTPQRNAGVVWLTQYSSAAQNASRLKMSPRADGRLLLLWEVWTASSYVATKGMTVAANGTIVSGETDLTSHVRLNRRDDPLSVNNSIYLVAGNKSDTVLELIVVESQSLTVAKSGTGGGTVASSPAGIDCGATCSASFGAGATITLTATSNAGSVFAGWTGGGCVGTGSCTLTLGVATTVTATFNTAPAGTFALTVAKTGTGSGTVTSAPAGISCGTSCVFSFNNNASVVLTAAPATGSTFAGWNGGGCSGTGICTVTMDAAKSVTAIFSLIAPSTFALTVSKAGAGTGTVTSSPAGINCGSTCAASFNSGTSVVLTALASAGSTFTGWSGECSGTGTCAVTMDAAKSVTATFNTAPPASTRLSNLSTRGQVQTGDNVMIGGFTIGGSAPKKVLVTARGPSLTAFGVIGALANPSLRLVSGQTVVATNDDWGTASNASEIQATGRAPANALESAILTTLNPGAYTAIVSGGSDGTGVGIVEAFELDRPDIPLTNLSTRGQVQTGDNVMIGGFVIEGTQPQTVLIRANGPSLTAFGVQGALANPTLRLNSGQTVVAENDDWQTASNAAAIQATGLAPTNALESAILVTLNPGAYTAIVSGVNGGTGVGIVEVFAR